MRCLVWARGEALIGTDMEKAQLSYQAGGVVLTLEQPRVIRCALHQKQTSVLLCGRGGLWKALPGEAGESAVIEQALRRAEREMREAAGAPTNVDAAKAHATDVITDLLGERGHHVHIEWSSATDR